MQVKVGGFFSGCPHSHEAHLYSEPTLPCLHSGMELLQQMQLWKRCLVHPKHSSSLDSPLPSVKASPLHPSAADPDFPSLCLPAQPQQGFFPCTGMFFQWQQLVPGCSSCHIKVSSSTAERLMTVVKVLHRAFQSKCCRALRGLHQNSSWVPPETAKESPGQHELHWEHVGALSRTWEGKHRERLTPFPLSWNRALQKL